MLRVMPGTGSMLPYKTRQVFNDPHTLATNDANNDAWAVYKMTKHIRTRETHSKSVLSDSATPSILNASNFLTVKGNVMFLECSARERSKTYPTC